MAVGDTGREASRISFLKYGLFLCSAERTVTDMRK